MDRLAMVVKGIIVCLPALTGCAGMGEVRYPQNPDEFLSVYNWGGIFQNVERITVNRPAGTVVANVKVFAKKCLDISVNRKRMGRYALDKYGSGTGGGPVTYNTKVGVIKNGSTALSVQESSNAKQSGLPPGGMYTMVAEVRAAGRNKTQVNIYHLAKPFIADPLKRWIVDGKRECPAL